MARSCVLSFFVCLACLGGAVPVRADDWKLIGTEQGIQIFRRELPGSRITALKGTGTVDAPVWKVASILLDTARASEWADSLKESRVVRRLALNRYIEYNHVGLPLIIKDRDFVSDVRIDVDPIGRTFALVYKPTDDPAAPVTRNVRGEIVSGLFEATSIGPDKRTRLTAEVQCDPKGALPSWIVNFFQKNWPLHTFEAIRIQAAKPDIAMPAEFTDVLTPTRQF
jgi:hypothetical protein